MYNIGTTYIDNRDNTAWTIAELGEYQNGTLYTVIDRKGNYKRHYSNKLDSIAEKLSSIRVVKTASLIGNQGIEVIFNVNSQWYNKLKRQNKVQSLVQSLDNSFNSSYYLNEVIGLDNPIYNDENKASKGLKVIKLIYTTSYDNLKHLKNLGILDNITSGTIKPYNPTITFNNNTDSSISQVESQNETLNIGGIDMPVNKNMPHSETDSLVCVDFKSRTIVDFKYWLSYIKPIK